MVAKPINHANAVSCPAHLIFCPVGHQGAASFITAIKGQAAVAPYALCTILACAAVCPVNARYGRMLRERSQRAGKRKPRPFNDFGAGATLQSLTPRTARPDANLSSAPVLAMARYRYQLITPPMSTPPMISQIIWMMPRGLSSATPWYWKKSR